MRTDADFSEAMKVVLPPVEEEGKYLEMILLYTTRLFD